MAMAEKETLARELDRKRASPTESAVMREKAKGTLWSRYAESEVGISVRHTLRVKRGELAFLEVSMRVVPRESIDNNPVPEYVTVFRDVSFGKFLFHLPGNTSHLGEYLPSCKEDAEHGIFGWSKAERDCRNSGDPGGKSCGKDCEDRGRRSYHS